MLRIPSLRHALVKISLLLLGALAALLTGELVVREGLGYPDYGVVRFIRGISSNIPWQPQYRAGSGYVNSENGLRVFRRNNLGLPGTGIDLNKRKIFVMGSSFIEAAQVNPHEMAVTHFQQQLAASYPQYAVLNLGRKAHDLYDCWFRYNYYKQIHPPECVVLIVDQRNSFARHPQPMNFNLPKGFGETDTRLRTIIGTAILSNSAMFSLYFKGFREILKTQSNDESEDTSLASGERKVINRNEELVSNINLCLGMFRQAGTPNLIVISIIPDKEVNREIKAYCDSQAIFCVVSEKIQNPANQFGGGGHFNVRGNRELGQLMAEAFCQYQQGQKNNLNTRAGR